MLQTLEIGENIGVKKLPMEYTQTTFKEQLASPMSTIAFQQGLVPGPGEAPNRVLTGNRSILNVTL